MLLRPSGEPKATTPSPICRLARRAERGGRQRPAPPGVEDGEVVDRAAADHGGLVAVALVVDDLDRAVFSAASSTTWLLVTDVALLVEHEAGAGRTALLASTSARSARCWAAAPARPTAMLPLSAGSGACDGVDAGQAAAGATGLLVGVVPLLARRRRRGHRRPGRRPAPRRRPAAARAAAGRAGAGHGRTAPAQPGGVAAVRRPGPAGPDGPGRLRGVATAGPAGTAGRPGCGRAAWSAGSPRIGRVCSTLGPARRAADPGASGAGRIRASAGRSRGDSHSLRLGRGGQGQPRRGGGALQRERAVRVLAVPVGAADSVRTATASVGRATVDAGGLRGHRHRQRRRRNAAPIEPTPIAATTSAAPVVRLGDRLAARASRAR